MFTEDIPTESRINLMTKPVSEMSPEERKRHKDGRARRREAKRLEIYSMYNYTCQGCGLREETQGFFEFHHLNPEKKDREIGSMINSASMTRIKQELAKCVMLCPNCHKREHLKEGMTFADIRKTNELNRT